ncbi:MAG: HutD family protein, partial [Myxococcales bacterium]|nr:HutD family protein [Myxococcales bacterium]
VTGHAPWAFAGEDPWSCRLLAGPVRDFNVMVDRTRYRAAVVAHGPGRVDARFVVALATGRIGGEAVEEGDLAVLGGEVACGVPVLAVHLRPA